MGKGSQTTTQQIDPAVRPYRDAFLRQAFQTAGNQPLSFYGMPGSTPGPFPGMNPGQPSSGGFRDMVGNIRSRMQGGRGGAQPMSIGSMDQPYLNMPPGGPNIGPGAPGGPTPNFGFGGAGDPYGVGGGYGQAVGGLDPWVAGASSYTQDALNTPINDRINSFMNPYEKSVVDATHGDFNYQRDQAMKAADDIATKERAFGGSRHGILASQMQQDINRNEASTLSGLRYGGYRDATGNAMADRNFMFGAGDYMRGIGQSGIDAARGRFDASQNLPFQRLGFMQSALTGVPMGSQTTQPGGNIFSQLLGLGMAGASFL